MNLFRCTGHYKAQGIIIDRTNGLLSILKYMLSSYLFVNYSVSLCLFTLILAGWLLMLAFLIYQEGNQVSRMPLIRGQVGAK